MAFDSTYRPEEVERTWRERWDAERAFHAPERAAGQPHINFHRGITA